MATDRTPTTIRGLLIPDPRLKYAQLSATLSSITQAGPLPGVPEPEQDTDLVLEATGRQSADKRLRLQVLKAGMPTPDEGGFVWRYSTDTDQRGWEPPQTISLWQPIDWTTTTGAWRNPHAVRTSNQTVVVAVQKGGNKVSTWRRDPDSYAWSEVEVYTHGTYSARARPTLCLLPDGRILLFFWVEDSALGRNQIRCHYSDDNGATWSLLNRACLRTPLTVSGTVSPGRLRAAYSNNQILLVAHTVDTSKTFDDVFVQYASNDQGANFSVVSTWTGSDEDQSGNYHEIVVHGGQFQFAYVRKVDGSSATRPYLRRITNAFEALATAQEIDIAGTVNDMWWGAHSGSAFTAGDLAMWRDDDGVLYLVGRDHNTAGGATYAIHVHRSVDGGDTWEPIGDTDANGQGACIYNNNDANRYLLDFCAVPVQGRALLVHRFHDAVASSGFNYGPSLCAAFLGGYTTVCLPSRYGYPIASERVAFDRVWLPFDLPDAAPMWTLGSIGSPALAITVNAELSISTGGADTVSYTTTPASSTLNEGLIAFAEVKKDSGDGTVYLRARIGVAGPTSYDIRVEVRTNAVVLRDMVAGADIATVATAAGGTEGVQILLGLNNPTGGTPGNDGKVYAVFRPAGASPDRRWTLLGTSSSLQAGTSTSNAIIFGHVGGAAVSKWRMVAGASDLYTGKQLTTFNNPSDLLPRNFSPDPLYVDDGVKIAARRGPARMNEVFYVNTRYEHGVEYAHPDVCPSPAVEWRAADETQQDLVWDFDADLNQETPPLSPVMGVYLGNVNFRFASLWGHDKDTGTDVLLADIDTAFGQDALRFIREGHRVRVDTSAPNAAAEYFTHNILAGSYFHLDGDQSSTVRRITTNTGGAWTHQLTKRPVLDLAGVQPTDATSGLTGEIWSKDVCVLVFNATKYTRLKLTIDAQPTAEGYLKAGVILLGHLVPFSRQYSFGRGQRWEPNADIQTHPSGARLVTTRGPLRRTASLPWVDGVDTSQLVGSPPVPDYILPHTGSTTPLGAPAETPYAVAGLVEELEGAKTPIVYLPHIPVPGSATQIVTIVNRNKMLYGRIVGPVTTQTLYGNEWSGMSGEVLTVESVAIEEEV